MERKTDVVELKKVMIDRGLDRISDLARASGVSRNTLSRIMNGCAQPSSDVMYKLTEALSLEPTHAGRIFFSIDLRKA